MVKGDKGEEVAVNEAEPSLEETNVLIGYTRKQKYPPHLHFCVLGVHRIVWLPIRRGDLDHHYRARRLSGEGPLGSNVLTRPRR